MFCTFLNIIENHIGLIISCVAIIFAYGMYLRDKRNDDKERLAKQVIAFYALEKEAVKEIKTHTNEITKQSWLGFVKRHNKM